MTKETKYMNNPIIKQDTACFYKLAETVVKPN